MGKALGICPHCGAVVLVKDELETGFCVKCRQQLDVRQSILAYQSSGATEQATVQQIQEETTLRSSTVQRRQAREEAAGTKARAANAKQKVRERLQMCSSEQDFLMLRGKVLQMDKTDAEKTDILAALDEATKERLSDTIKLAKEYEESKESPMSLILGCIFIVAIGFAIQHFFSIGWAGIASIVLAVLGLFGSFSDKMDKKKTEQRQSAAELISAYREQGYKL